MISILANHRGDTVLHLSGFSWLAFTALPIWAFHRGHLKSSLVLTALCFAIHGAIFEMADHLDDEGARLLVQAGWLLSFSGASGLLANRCHAWALRKAGFVVCAVDSP